MLQDGQTPPFQNLLVLVTDDGKKAYTYAKSFEREDEDFSIGTQVAVCRVVKEHSYGFEATVNVESVNPIVGQQSFVVLRKWRDGWAERWFDAVLEDEIIGQRETVKAKE